MLVLGVDGGGTKTLAVLADRAGTVVRVTAGPDTNPLDQPRWGEHLADVVGRARRDHVLAAAAFGLPVHGEVADISRQQRAAAVRLAGPRASVRNDVHTAHEAAFAGGAGVLLLAGTGSMCWAADAEGRTVRVGGWGDGFGDEGSAHWIGHRAITLLSRCLDGRLDGDDFARSLLEAIGVPRVGAQDALLTWFYGHANRRPAVAALAATVDRLAADGDPIAEGLLAGAADALALHVAAARHRLVLPDAWCFVGGVARSATMRALLAARLGPPTPPVLPPVGGAVWRAATDAGWNPDAAWIATLARDLASRPELS